MNKPWHCDDFKTASSSCAFCWLSNHSNDENDFVFSRVRAEEPEMVEMLLEEHRGIERKLEGISGISEALKQTEDIGQRIQMGENLNRKANDMFGYYITHMNKEEITIVPALQKYLTDEQIRAIRAAIQRNIPPDRIPIAMRFILSSMNINELTDLVSGMEKETPPPVFQGMAKMIE